MLICFLLCGSNATILNHFRRPNGLFFSYTSAISQNHAHFSLLYFEVMILLYSFYFPIFLEFFFVFFSSNIFFLFLFQVESDIPRYRLLFLLLLLFILLGILRVEFVFWCLSLILENSQSFLLQIFLLFILLFLFFPKFLLCGHGTFCHRDNTVLKYSFPSFKFFFSIYT